MDERRAAAIVFAILGVACRIIAIVLCVLTVALCFNGVVTRLNIVAFIVDLTQALPDVIAGYGLIPTPFGGVFRFDFACMVVVFFGIDYACSRVAGLLR